MRRIGPSAASALPGLLDVAKLERCPRVLAIAIEAYFALATNRPVDLVLVPDESSDLRSLGTSIVAGALEQFVTHCVQEAAVWSFLSAKGVKMVHIGRRC